MLQFPNSSIFGYSKSLRISVAVTPYRALISIVIVKRVIVWYRTIMKRSVNFTIRGIYVLSLFSFIAIPNRKVHIFIVKDYSTSKMNSSFGVMFFISFIDNLKIFQAIISKLSSGYASKRFFSY